MKQKKKVKKPRKEVKRKVKLVKKIKKGAKKERRKKDKVKKRIGKKKILKQKKASKHRKAKHPNKVSTGIKTLDKMTKGGFEYNSTNLIVGTTGAGKTILALQFILDGLKKGEPCLFITFEERKEEFFSSMKDIGWDLAKLEKQGKFTFLEYTPQKVKTMLEEGGGAIESIVLRRKIKRLVIDSITSFELLFDKDVKRREASLRLFNMLTKWDCTSLLTYEGDPSKGKKAVSESIAFEADSIILLYFIRDKNERGRYIEVLKMRGTNHSTRVFSFDIVKGGIKISNKPSSLKFD